MDVKQLLLDFSAQTGVSGLEREAVAWAAERLGEFGPVTITPLGSALCRVWDVDSPHHLLLDAHIDEIGLIVTAIEDGGFLRVAPCGGVDRRILPAYPVTIHTKGGPLHGVVCSTPPHLSDGDNKNLKVEEIAIDTGFSKEEAAQRIRLGDRITLRGPADELCDGQIFGKAIDDRAGCVALLRALDLLRDQAPICNLSVLFSSMEEVGGQGAGTATYGAAPTHALAVEVTFAHTPDAKKHQTGELGGGTMIGYAPILSTALSDKLRDLALAENIPHQVEVMSGRTGTNADAIAVARGGVRTALLSIPQKYMHTPIEAVAVSDVESTARLIAAFVREFVKGGDTL